MRWSSPPAAPRARSGRNRRGHRAAARFRRHASSGPSSADSRRHRFPPAPPGHRQHRPTPGPTPPHRHSTAEPAWPAPDCVSRPSTDSYCKPDAGCLRDCRPATRPRPHGLRCWPHGLCHTRLYPQPHWDRRHGIQAPCHRSTSAAPRIWSRPPQWPRRTLRSSPGQHPFKIVCRAATRRA